MQIGYAAFCRVLSISISCENNIEPILIQFQNSKFLFQHCVDTGLISMCMSRNEICNASQAVDWH